METLKVLTWAGTKEYTTAESLVDQLAGWLVVWMVETKASWLAEVLVYSQVAR